MSVARALRSERRDWPVVERAVVNAVRAEVVRFWVEGEEVVEMVEVEGGRGAVDEVAVVVVVVGVVKEEDERGAAGGGEEEEEDIWDMVVLNNEDFG